MPSLDLKIRTLFQVFGMGPHALRRKTGRDMAAEKPVAAGLEHRGRRPRAKGGEQPPGSGFAAIPAGRNVLCWHLDLSKICAEILIYRTGR